MREVLVTGGGGQLGTALGRYAWPTGWAIVTSDQPDLDLADPVAIAAKVAERPWAAVINAGAHTAVDRAEDEPVLAWRINALAPAAFAQACHAAAIPLVQVSTDYVFSGHKAGAWDVDDAVGPLNVYGASKLGGELAVRTGCPRHVIVRTAWVVSATGHNFVKTMLRVGAGRTTLSVVADQHGSPTSAADLAAALATIAIRLVEEPDAPMGTFHFSNAGATTWHGFAEEIFRQAAARGHHPAPEVLPVTTADYPTPARRPANSLLDHRAITDAYGIRPRPWQVALSDIVDELLGTST